MKKIILALASSLLFAGIISAQDLASAIEAYNNGAEALSIGDKVTALAKFQSALSIAEACGDEGAEVVTNCKNAIPGIILSLGKELYNNKDFDGALEKVREALNVAKKYENAEITKEAEELLPQISIMKDMTAANDAFDAKNLPAAIESYKKVIAADSTNGVAALRLVQCLSTIGDIDGAKDFVKAAEANGQGENAKKVIGTALLKKSAASLKAGKFADAKDQALESVVFSENAQAYLVAGQASTKLNKTSDAITNFEKYLEIEPNAKNAGSIALTIGALYQGQKNNAKALEFYKKAQAAGADAKAYIDALSK